MMQRKQKEKGKKKHNEQSKWKTQIVLLDTSHLKQELFGFKLAFPSPILYSAPFSFSYFPFFFFLQNLSILLKEKIIPDRPSSSPYFMRLPLISLMFLSTPFQKNFSILSRNLSTSHSQWPLSTSPPNSLIFPKIPS